MNLVEELTTKLGLTGNVAEGLAGQVLALIDDRLRDRAPGSSTALQAAFPDMTRWRGAAPTLRPGLTLKDLEAMAKENELVELLRRFGVDGARATQFGSVVVTHLATRLDPRTMADVSRVFP